MTEQQPSHSGDDSLLIAMGSNSGGGKKSESPFSIPQLALYLGMSSVWPFNWVEGSPLVNNPHLLRLCQYLIAWKLYRG